MKVKVPINSNGKNGKQYIYNIYIHIYIYTYIHIYNIYKNGKQYIYNLLLFCTPKLDKDESESDHESQRKTSESDTKLSGRLHFFQMPNCLVSPSE